MLISALHVSVPVCFSQMIISFLHEVQSVILGIISAVVPGSESFCFFMLLLALHVCSIKHSYSLPTWHLLLCISLSLSKTRGN